MLPVKTLTYICRVHKTVIILDAGSSLLSIENPSAHAILKDLLIYYVCSVNRL